jgi:hypothetical protein
MRHGDAKELGNNVINGSATIPKTSEEKQAVMVTGVKLHDACALTASPLHVMTSNSLRRDLRKSQEMR